MAHSTPEKLTPPGTCHTCGEAIKTRPFMRIEVRRMLPREGFHEYSQVVTLTDYHEECVTAALTGLS